jgi:hypothetical protein
LTLNLRTHCPSCHQRITPLALECPQCGLGLARQPLPRPLLFQASALRLGGPAREDKQTLSTPALGRVEPMTILEKVPAEAEPDPPFPDPGLRLETPSAVSGNLELTDSFWPVVKMEAMECVILLALNGALALVACWMAGGPPSMVYPNLWSYLLPVHAAISWAYLMVPLVLVGQSPMMGMQHLLLDTDLPERRMSFSLLHLISALAFPVSFLCMVLTPNHRTLAELLSGLEILQVPSRRR